tara:strand:+ start:323 stop:1363 length:1041 start_codon:yes stop_codon:yes gene_type:complete
MRIYLFLPSLIIVLVFSGCSVKSIKSSFQLPEISLEDEKEEIFLQKELLLNEMISSSKILHQISWPILKNNRDICYQDGSYSFGVLFATQTDLPKKDLKYFKKIFNKNIKSFYFKKYQVDSFPVVVSISQDSPAYQSNLLEGDIVLKISDLNVKNFRSKLKKSIRRSSKLKLTILRNEEIIRKEINGVKICNYNIQAIPSPAPNAYADGEKVFITLAAIKLARTNDELAFLIGHELAHNIFHYKYIKGSEANSLAINYNDAPKLKNFNSFFLYSSQAKEIEADLKGVEIAYKGGYSLDNVNDYWRRLSVFNPNMISSSSSVYKSNALRAIMISKTLKKLKNEDDRK